MLYFFHRLDTLFRCFALHVFFFDALKKFGTFIFNKLAWQTLYRLAAFLLSLSYEVHVYLFLGMPCGRLLYRLRGKMDLAVISTLSAWNSWYLVQKSKLKCTLNTPEKKTCCTSRKSDIKSFHLGLELSQKVFLVIQFWPFFGNWTAFFLLSAAITSFSRRKGSLTHGYYDRVDCHCRYSHWDSQGKKYCPKYVALILFESVVLFLSLVISHVLG